jgi:hypothetical protein
MPRVGCEDALDKQMIAELPDDVIAALTRDELLRLIQAAAVPVLNRAELADRLPFYEHALLVRLAHLARHCCQNQRHGMAT